MSDVFKNHPCFDDEARHKFQRVHLPVASRCNIQCNFCNRKFDCINESRPGVTSGILSPTEASNFVDDLVRLTPNLTVTGIAGPGDPFANPAETMETLRLVRQSHPKMLLCVATNGLNIKNYINELAELKVSHITITINAVSPDIGARIYSWARIDKKVVGADTAAIVLLENQLEAVSLLKEKNITVKINSIIIPGINDFHIPEIAKKLGKIGADIFNPLPLYPVPGTDFAKIHEPDKELIKNIKFEVKKYINVMHNCTRCRADAAGFLGENKTVFDMKELFLNKCQDTGGDKKLLNKNIAAASIEGLLINRHLGEASYLDIYIKKDGKYFFLEKRNTPERGSGDARWSKLAEVLSDCDLVLTAGAGANPVKILSRSGIRVITTSGMIDEVLKDIAKGIDLKKIEKRFSGCGISCSGTGSGCG